LAPEPNPDPGAGDARHFITLVIVVIIALVLSPLIFQAIKSANSSGNITGTLATIVNLVPLFYFLAVAVLTVADVYLRLRLFKGSTEMRQIVGRLLFELYEALAIVASMLEQAMASLYAHQLVGV